MSSPKHTAPRHNRTVRRLLDVAMRAVPTMLLVRLERTPAPLGARLADLAWREGLRRWRSGRRAHDHFVPF